MEVTHVVISISKDSFEGILTFNRDVYLLTQEATLREVESLLDQKIGAGKYKVIKLKRLSGKGYHI